MALNVPAAVGQRQTVFRTEIASASAETRKVLSPRSFIYTGVTYVTDWTCGRKRPKSAARNSLFGKLVVFCWVA